MCNVCGRYVMIHSNIPVGMCEPPPLPYGDGLSSSTIVGSITKDVEYISLKAYADYVGIYGWDTVRLYTVWLLYDQCYTEQKVTELLHEIRKDSSQFKDFLKTVLTK